MVEKSHKFLICRNVPNDFKSLRMTLKRKFIYSLKHTSYFHLPQLPTCIAVPYSITVKLLLLFY